LIGGSLATGIALPFSALQILWINFISDSFPAIALAFENHVDYLSPKFKRLGEHLLDWEIKFLVFAIGLPTSVLIFALYWLLLNLGYDQEIVRTFIFAAFAVYSLVLIFSVRSLRTPIYKYNFFSNPFLLACVAFGIGLIGLAIYHPFFQELFGTVALPLNWLAAVAGVGLLNIAMIEGGKMLIHRNDPA
jgi:magnesium-transporting ATPase (P-type)